MQHDWSLAREGSIAKHIRAESHEGCAIALLGLADDTGVALNHGRVGAADGPAAFRKALMRFGMAYDSRARLPLDMHIFDAGDVEPQESLQATHNAVTKRVLELLNMGMLPICVGGGHDLTWPAVRALDEHIMQPFSGMYVDAHLDVREEPGSGMPFRMILNHTRCASLTVLGLNPFANRQDHVEWFCEHGGCIADDLNLPAPDQTLSFASFDLDAVAASDAPGVSAPNPCGMNPHDAANIAQAIGCSASIRLFDIMELNPAFDVDDHTARLAVQLFCAFLAGFAQRS
ncbi:MAG: formimidoylglutamase [Phycisphaerales bacterium]